MALSHETLHFRSLRKSHFPVLTVHIVPQFPYPSSDASLLNLLKGRKMCKEFSTLWDQQPSKTKTVRTKTDPLATSKATRPTGNAAHSESFHGDATSEHKDNSKDTRNVHKIYRTVKP